jgi:hypothetical protein
VPEDVSAELFGGDGLGMLGGNHDGIDADGLVVLVVLDCDLGFAVGAKPGELAGLADFSEPAGELVGQRDGGGHQLGGLVGGIAEHHALVAGAAGIHAHGDVAGLLVDGGDDGAGVGVESVDGVVVADGGDDAADQRLEIDVGAGGDFAGDDDQAGSGEGLAGDAAVGVLLEAGVEDGVRDLIGDLIGMTFGDGFRGEKESFRCWQGISSRLNADCLVEWAAGSGGIVLLW